MKKVLMLILTITLLLNFVCIRADDGINLYLDGERITSNPSPIIVNSRTMIPVRAVFEKMGAKISWDNETRTVTVSYKDINI